MSQMHDFSHPQLAVVMPARADVSVVNALEAIGDDVSVEIVEGETGIRHLDVDGSEHGLTASIKRAIQEEQRPIARLVDALADGRSVLFAHNVDGNRRDQAVEVFADVDVEVMYHFGDATWQRLGESG